MNPFDLRGPEFLGFYAVFAAVVVVVTWLVRRGLDGTGAPPRLSDPYALAMIREGRTEAVKTALLALHERGAIKIDDDAAVPEDGAHFAPGLEAALAARLKRNASWKGAEHDAGVKSALDAMESSLVAKGLLPSSATIAKRKALLITSELVLLGVAATKIAIALSRGRTNVLFLIILAGVAAVVTWWVSRSRTTSLGDRVVDDVRTLLLGRRRILRRASHPDPEDWSAMVALLAAVGSHSYVPGTSAVRRALWPPPPPSATSAWGSSCGSTWSSSCGSSCGGSSCGGGCGGGGCGGCGSS